MEGGREKRDTHTKASGGRPESICFTKSEGGVGRRLGRVDGGWWGVEEGMGWGCVMSGAPERRDGTQWPHSD